MNEQNIQKLLGALFSLKCDERIGENLYEFNIIRSYGKIDVEQTIRSFINNIDDEITILKSTICGLEAKIFVYERIISNSNFAPIILPKNAYEDESQ